MHLNYMSAVTLAGIAAGAVNGLFGAGGGMVLVPLLTMTGKLEEKSVFPSSLAIILPICIVSLTAAAVSGRIPWDESVPYLIGSAIGGLIAGKCGQKIPLIWLHRALGILIICGGIRYLCQTH